MKSKIHLTPLLLSQLARFELKFPNLTAEKKNKDITAKRCVHLRMIGDAVFRPQPEKHSHIRLRLSMSESVAAGSRPLVWMSSYSIQKSICKLAWAG